MQSVELTRHVAADPASVALILAGPSTRDESVIGDTGVLRLVAPATSDVAGVMVAAPRRSGVGFAATLDVSDGSGHTVSGTVRAVPSSDAGCELRLLLEAVPEREAHTLAREARLFLDQLVKRARSRAYAA